MPLVLWIFVHVRVVVFSYSAISAVFCSGSVLQPSLCQQEGLFTCAVHCLSQSILIRVSALSVVLTTVIIAPADSFTYSSLLY